MKTSAPENYVKCTDCALDPLCRPIEGASGDFDLIKELLSQRQQIKAGETLCEYDAPFESLFAISAGSFKHLTPEGGSPTRVCGFSFAGELIGHTGMAKGRYPYTAIANEDSYVCSIPYQKFIGYAEHVPKLRERLLSMLCEEGHHTQQAFSMMMGRKNVDQRLAALLLNLALRHTQRGFEQDEFKLNMRREDIANFLGLPKETMSRAMKKLQSNDIISVQGRKILIPNIELLRETAGL